MHESMKLFSHDDSALAIEKDQTISQTYIVALMTEAMELNGDEKTLEIGTGHRLSSRHLCRVIKDHLFS